MPDTKISDLPAVATPALTDQFAVNQGGASKKMTLQQIGGVSGGFTPLGTSRIRVASTTSLELGLGVVPLLVNSIWQPRAITSVVTISNASLSANTTYFVYLFDNAGTSTLELSTTTHTTDSAFGVETKSADTSRTLVGMIRTNASSQFQDDALLLGALSYFSRRNKSIANSYTTTRTTTSATLVELHSEIRANFLVWSDDAVILLVSGSGSVNVVAGTQWAFGIDSTTSGGAPRCSTDSTVSTAIALSLATGLAEGFHFVTLLGQIAGGNTLSGNSNTLLGIVSRG